MGGGGSGPKAPNLWIGTWGDMGVVTYGVAPNRLRPLAGTLHAAFFNTFRRTKSQILFIVPPFLVAYAAMQWAVERNHYLNSKAGRAEFADEE